MKQTMRCAFCLAGLCMLFLAACGRADAPAVTGTTNVPETTQQEFVYTWEEYEALPIEEQIAFQNSFESPADFDTWLQGVQTDRAEMPWDMGGKRPEEYTWEEFEDLTAQQQIVFQDSFSEPGGFDRWMETVRNTGLELPWESGGKQPKEYTWEEFEALSAELQIAFQDSFGSFHAFDAWMQNAWQEEPFSWESDGRPLAEYTWEEFENMTPEEQMAFQNAFESWEAFDQWMVQAQADEEVQPWDSGEKEPSEYTWEEFEALSAEQQIRFQSSFDSVEQFEQWLFENIP